MNCASLNGFTLGCRDGIGGVKEFYLAPLSSITSYTETNGEVTITMVSGETFSKYELENETSTYTDNGVDNRGNGTIMYDHSLTAIFNDKTVKEELANLAGHRLAVIVTDNEGVHSVFGLETGAMTVSRNGATGTSFEDRNGYEVVIQSRQKDRRFTISTAHLNNII
jgi:hypothetical protein